MSNLQNPQNDGRRKLVVRGDLRSRTGLAYHVRAQTRLLAEDFDVMGVDVHPDPDDREGDFTYPVIKDEDIARVIAAADIPPVVLHHTPPEDFRCFPGAYNVGSFAWETDVRPMRGQWPLKVAMMEGMWAQCTMIGDLIRAMGYRGPVGAITWPFEFGETFHGEMKRREEIGLRAFGRLDGRKFVVAPISLAAARAGARNLFVTVQSMSARKGLPIMLGAWRKHMLQAENRADLLLLRLAFRHASNLARTLEEHLSTTLEDAGFRSGEDARVAVVERPLDDGELSELYVASDAYVSTTLGEGFGGPIVEAIQRARPVIAPRHTALFDFIPPDYPLTVASRRLVVGLRGGLPVYPPASSWHVPDLDSFADHLQTFSRLDLTARRQLVVDLRRSANGFCSTLVVRHAMQEFFRELFAQPLHGATA